MTTIIKKIKSELFNAEMNYLKAYDEFVSKYPNGVSFLSETVSIQAALDTIKLRKAESFFNALVGLVTPKFSCGEMNMEIRKIHARWETAETEKEIQEIEKEYFKFYSIK